MQRSGFIFPHLPFRDIFEERRIEAGVIPNISYIRIYEQESNRTGEQGTIETGKKKGRQVLGWHKLEDMREFVTCV